MTPEAGTPGSQAGFVAVVVTYESADVIGDCLHALRGAAPRRGVEIRVVDNASRDDGAARAAAILGEACVRRLGANRGFAAGVNAGLIGADAPWLAIVNPDLRTAPGMLDALADFLERAPRAGLAGPRVDLPDGSREPTAGVFPTPGRERAHAWMADRWLGRRGRRRPQPEQPEAVDWVSGCAWVLKRAAWEQVGALDETFFMYFEDVDYCRRLGDAGWEVWCVPSAGAVHHRGTGSKQSGTVPADGGPAAVRYLAKHFPGPGQDRLAEILRTGWRIRVWLHSILSALGRRRSGALARRYREALRATHPGDRGGPARP